MLGQIRAIPILRIRCEARRHNEADSVQSGKCAVSFAALKHRKADAARVPCDGAGVRPQPWRTIQVVMQKRSARDGWTLWRTQSEAKSTCRNSTAQRSAAPGHGLRVAGSSRSARRE